MTSAPKWARGSRGGLAVHPIKAFAEQFVPGRFAFAARFLRKQSHLVATTAQCLRGREDVRLRPAEAAEYIVDQ